MSTEKLTFLQNFYTDVTLYVPAEPEAVPAAPASAVTVEAKASVPKPPTRDVQVPSRGFSHPSAGLERLATGFGQSAVAGAGPVVPTASPQPTPGANLGGSTNGIPIIQQPVTDSSIVPPAVPAVSPVMLTTFSTLGSNAQGVILLFRLPHEQFIKLHRNVFLNKMLQALNLVMADVVLVNVESELPVGLVNLRRELAATHIIAFGKNLLDVTIRNTQIYEPVLFPSLGLSYLSSATVDLVEYDVSLKKRLWPGLKAMFL
ncbi:hypothetical protein [Hymenobacter terrenus]|uniref:hypothetical protein n=1 Tax=Hymenobacter terrenus TaxID=1629124 RepID=UPI000A54930B|nr:hypothetical protein [Hymenobacter terrenus]